MESLTAYLNRKIKAVLGYGLLENVIVDYIIVTEEANRRIDKDGLIIEAKTVFNPIPGVKHYTYRIDKQLGDGGPGRQRHIHIYYNGDELFAMNADLSAHDSYHQVKIPNEIVPFLNDKGFPVPADYIIEMLYTPDHKEILCEGLNYEAINRLALNAGEAIRKASVVSIIEANVETYQVKEHSKVVGKYQHVNHLEDIPQCHVHGVKQVLINLLQELGTFGETFDIFDDNLTAPHRLFVAWNEQL